MLAPAFELSLGHPVLRGLVTVGRFDGVHPSLACGTKAGKVLLHAPHETDASGRNGVGAAAAGLRFLSINREICSITAGALAPPGEGHAQGRAPKDLLFLGTASNIMAYDVEQNADRFFLEVQDGANAVVVGEMPGSAGPLALVGGNCSLYGYDGAGEEQFWTVTGDNVTAMAFCDVDGDGQAELLVGSEDYAIRMFRGEEVVQEVAEADKVLHLTALQGPRYSYGLGNGTIGVYDGQRRLWRTRTKHEVTAMLSFDLDGDGVPEVLTGLANGAFTVSTVAEGTIIFKDALPSAVAGLADADYRLDGHEEVLVVGGSGEVRAYLPAEGHQGRARLDEAQDRRAIEQLQTRKADLLLELKSLEDGLRSRRSGTRESQGLLPPRTQVTPQLRHGENGKLEVLLFSSTDAVIVHAVVRDASGGAFDSELLVASPPVPSRTVVVPLPLRRDKETQLVIQALVGARASSSQLLVFELEHPLPRFARFRPDPQPPGGGRHGLEHTPAAVTFVVPENKLARLRNFVQQSFVSCRDLAGTDDSVHYAFVAEASNAPSPQRLGIEALRHDHLRVRVICDDMELAGEVVQGLCRFLHIGELESHGHFPAEMERFAKLLQQVASYNEVRVRLTADMADGSDRVKALVIRAEDARLLGDMETMRRMYADLYGLNGELIGEYNKRATNHTALLAKLKDVNNMISKAANLRVGTAKARVVAECRSAIKQDNLQGLLQIASHGSALRGRQGG